MDDKNFTVSVEAFLYNTQNLYTSADGKVSVDFNFEGGYDTYEWSSNKKYGTPYCNGKYDAEYHAANDSYSSSTGKRVLAKGIGTDNESYSLYALPTVQLNYQATPSVKVYAAAGAEYRNWAIKNESSATNWRWQPTVFAGFKTTF